MSSPLPYLQSLVEGNGEEIIRTSSPHHLKLILSCFHQFRREVQGGKKSQRVWRVVEKARRLKSPNTLRTFFLKEIKVVRVVVSSCLLAAVKEEICHLLASTT
jgi:hypothetical protein